MTHISESTTLSQDVPGSLASKQMERYHSTEDNYGKLREEFSSYRSQS